MDTNDTDQPYLTALRSLIRNGVTAAPHLEGTPLVDLPIIVKQVGLGASATQRAQTFIDVLQDLARHGLKGKEAVITRALFGLDEFSGLPIQERYHAVAKTYDPLGTWESYRKEPLTRHLQVVYLALKRQAEQPARRALRVLIVQNITREAPGLLERLLHELAIDYDIANLDAGDPFPDPTAYGALVILGGPDSANDKTPKMQLELQRVKQALDAGIPYLGICLGLQVAVKVMGGKVLPSPVREVGLHDHRGQPYSVSLTNLALTALGKKDPLFIGLENRFRVFQLHGETVEMTRSMQLLAIGQDCPNQIVKLAPNAYGIQSHFELTKPMLTEWMRADPDLTPLDEQEALRQFAEIEEVYTLTGLSLMRNFLHIAGLLSPQ